jgi:hypothetical protein
VTVVSETPKEEIVCALLTATSQSTKVYSAQNYLVKDDFNENNSKCFNKLRDSSLTVKVISKEQVSK